MTPTMKLRLVKREIKHHHIPTSTTAETPYTTYTSMILQQWWAESLVSLGWANIEPSKRGEWRDVPVEDENGN